MKAQHPYLAYPVWCPVLPLLLVSLPSVDVDADAFNGVFDLLAIVIILIKSKIIKSGGKQQSQEVGGVFTTPGPPPPLGAHPPLPLFPNFQLKFAIFEDINLILIR
jgi:hypothetical protein